MNVSHQMEVLSSCSSGPWVTDLHCTRSWILKTQEW